MASLLADPCKFVLCVAVGYAHLLEPLLAFLERAASAHKCDPVVVAAINLLAVVVLVAYLLGAILVFAVCVAADGYARIVVHGGAVTRAQAASSLSPAAVLGWLADLIVKLAIALFLFGVLLCVLFSVVLAAGN